MAAFYDRFTCKALVSGCSHCNINQMRRLDILDIEARLHFHPDSSDYSQYPMFNISIGLTLLLLLIAKWVIVKTLIEVYTIRQMHVVNIVDTLRVGCITAFKSPLH